MSPHDESIPARDLRVYRPPPDRGDNDQISFQDIIDRIRAGLPNFGGDGGSGPSGGRLIGGARLIVLIIFVISVAGWLGSGVYTVDPGEQGVLRTFGEFTAFSDPGLHWHWPAPIGTRNVIATAQTRRMEIGFRSGPDGTEVRRDVREESLMITGDENLVLVDMVVQYRISDPRVFLFEVDDPGDPDRGISAGQPDGRTLRDVAESALRQVVGARPIDDVLTVEKEQIQTDVRVKMEEILSFYSTGIDVQRVLLQNVNPPEQVQDAFEDVVRAREDKERIINLAQAYREDQLPKARGEAAKIVEAAEGFRQGRIAEAEGQAAGFEAILAGYRESPEVTRQRLYLEAMEDILPGIKKFVISEKGVLPFLPLGDTGQLGVPATGQTGGGR